MKKWYMALLVTLCGFFLISCSRENEAGKKEEKVDVIKYRIELEIECAENLFFSKYDVRVLVDDNELGILEHGSTETYSAELEEGEYVFRVEKEEDSSVDGTIKFHVTEDMRLKCKLYCKSDQIKIEQTEEVHPPMGAEELNDKKYKEVKTAFEDAGFMNIEEKVIKDLTEDKLDEKEVVTGISIGGESSFTKEDKFPADAKVVIEYHVQTDIQMVEEEEESEKEEIITPDNNSELADILLIQNEFDPKIKEFAYKYAGEMIEFDAYTAAVSKNEDYDTRYNYLIYAGDYSESSVSGPSFQFHNVSYYDLNLEGDNIPETFGVGLNIHVIAVVGEYNEMNGLFELDPVAITMR